MSASSFGSASVAEGQLFSSGMQCLTKLVYVLAGRSLRAAAAGTAIHCRAEELVDSSLIAASLGFQPREHVRIETNRERFLDRPIELAHNRPGPVPYFGRV